jgi:hypothetical protein
MWNRLKQFLPSKKNNTVSTLLKANDAVFKDTRDITECLKKYFCNISYELGKQFDNNLPTVQDQMPKNSYTISGVTAEFIENKINPMLTCKATGF